MEVIQMAHAGTMDLGKAQTAPSGRRLAAGIAVIAVATVAVVGFANASGFAATTAKPADDHSLDQIEARRGAGALSIDNSYNRIEAKRGGMTLVLPAANSDEQTGRLRAGSYSALPAPKVVAVSPKLGADEQTGRLVGGSYEPLQSAPQRDRVGGP